MLIPESVKVGPYEYRVVIVDDLHSSTDRNVALFGEVLYKPQEIRIRAGMDDGHRLSTLLHEVIHVLDDEMYVIDMSEKQIKCLGVGLAAFLLDNGLLREEAE